MSDERIIEAVKSHVWSVILADHLGDAWRGIEELVAAVGLPAPLYDEECESHVVPWEVDPRFPDQDDPPADRYARVKGRNDG